jgi:Fe2+ or Zn2+ uptake regulation protein
MARRNAESPAAIELAARGLRTTRQRIAVFELLRRTPAHPTAAEVYRQLVRRQPNLSLKTVYDALDALVGAGLASCVTDGGAPYRYEANALVDVPASADGHIRGRTHLPEGFEVDEIRVTLVGRCPGCRDEI